jgi:ABC-type amino acid transport substrate-binding protein
VIKTITLLLTGIMAILSSGANAAEQPLRVGTAANHPPLAYVAEGKVVGMEADLARLLETQLGRPLQFKIFTPAELLPALGRGEIDLVMSGLTITPEREQLADFTLPYLQVGQMAVIRTADVLKFRNPGSLLDGGFRVGFIKDSTGAAYVKAHMNKAVAVPSASAEAGLQALLDKTSDVFIGDASSSWIIATEPRYGDLMSLNHPLTEEFLAWAVAKKNQPLREQLNEILLRMKQQPVFEHILNRWIPMRPASD